MININKNYNKFIDFCKRYNIYDKEAFDYLRNNSFMFDYRDDDFRIYIGCFFIVNHGKLEDINLVVPYIDNDITILINIHEYVHGLIAYSNIGKSFKKSNKYEILSLFFEKMFIKENLDNKVLIDYYNKLNERIDYDKDLNYVIGDLVSNDLSLYYSNNDNLEVLEKKARKCLVKRKVNKWFFGKN